MAVCNEAQGIKQIANSIGQVSIFGPCDESAIHSVASEYERMEMKRLKEQKEREEINRKFDEERRRQEEEDQKFAEQEFINTMRIIDAETSIMQDYPSRGSVGGRSKRYQEYLPPAKGRGLSKRQIQNSKKISPQKEGYQSNYIDRFAGGNNAHSNKRQELYWQGETLPYTGTAMHPSYDIQDPDNDFNGALEAIPFTNQTNIPEDGRLFVNIDPASANGCNVALPDDTNYSQFGYKTPDLESPYNFDQFEDANNSSSVSTKETSPFQSLSSSSSTSPVQQKLCGLGIKPRKPRVVNFLSNKIREENTVAQNDFFKEPQSSPRPVASRSTGLSINSLRASQRVFGDMGIRSSDVVRNSNLYPKTNSSFSLNRDDFPPL